MSITLNANIHQAALDLVKANVEAEPAIVKAYLFPSDQEIRLVYVDPTTTPLSVGERIAPYYFSPSKGDGSPYVSAIALVLPEEEGYAPLPEGWGSWSDGEVVLGQ